MFALALSSLLVLAAAWTLVSDSSTAAMLVYLVSAAAVASRLAVLAVTRRGLPVSAVWSVVWVALPSAWYFTNALAIQDPDAARRHAAEITGAVLPGLVLGASAAMAIGRRLRAAPKSIGLQRERQLRLLVALDGLIVAAVAVFLYTNTAEGILLISTALLAGAETYQLLGDALTINLALVWVLIGLRTPGVGEARHPRWLVGSGLPLLITGTVSCAVLAGSNKLLLVATVAGLIMLWTAVGNWISRVRHPAPVLALAAATLAVAGAGLMRSEVVSDVLALTRLLDYGNVASILDTPSIASRLEILEGCARRQFALGPFAGNLAAEFKTCGDGHYLHSLMSIQTHLGLVGTCLFLVPLVRVMYLTSERIAYRPIVPVLATLLLVGLVAAHFTWMPFWFVMGLAAGLYGEPRRSSAQTWDSISQGPVLRA